MSSTRIYLNPNCSKCRLSMQLLDDKGIKPDVTEDLNEPHSTDALNEILDLLSMEPREVMRPHEAPYQELKLAD